MVRSSFLYWFTFVLCLPGMSAYAQGGTGITKHPDEMLDYRALLPSSEGILAGVRPLFGQVTLQACQAGKVYLEPLTLVIPEDALPTPYTVAVQYYPGVAPNDNLPEDVINLTHQGGHVRMTPSDIYHEGQLLLSIKVEADQIPAWGDAHDIVGLQFSAQTGWSQVKLYQWDAKAQVATFLTDPFAEFIAGIIQTPELSPTTAIVSTEIKDYKTPPPHAGISMIKPPSPNNMGSANLSYPIEIPPGRAGMQPNLSINYNSNGGNGWMGMGWDLSVPSISIDTRWGVPLYDPELETETYTFQGQMLYPVAHRGERVNREANRVFHPRVEGAFAEVIRHGDHPSAYWWEVIEKNGRRRFYGASKASQEVLSEATLSTADGNIAKWFLVEEWDLNGNVIRYTYEDEVDNGPDDNHSLGWNMYPATINYTGREESTGEYTVRLVRERGITPNTSRLDAYSNCNYGFKKITASLLKRIEVLVGDEQIRSYELQYESGVFEKTLLKSIIHLDSDGVEFYDHHFDYFDDTVNDDNGFEPVTEYRTRQYESDELNGGLLSDNVGGYPDETSLLGGNKANNFSAGIAVTVGRVGSFTCKRGTIGGHYMFSKTQGRGINAFLDINGDNLPDKVFVKNGHIFFRPCLGVIDGGIAYGDSLQIIIEDRVSSISRPQTKSHSFGPEATFGGTYVSYTKSKAKTTEPVYFQDFNADGLVDMAFFGRVYFNRTVDGRQVFLPSSAGTINPIPMNGNVAISDEITAGFAEPDFEEQNPLHDAVRVWLVPYDGTVRITSQLQLLEEDSDDYRSYDLKDGVYARMEHNYVDNNDEFSLLYEQVIDTLQTGQIFEDTNIVDVKRGDMIFFRVNSRYDGAYDEVAWVANIDYVNSTDDPTLRELCDPNGQNLYHFNSAEDFLLSAPQDIGMPMVGEIKVRNELHIPSLTDSVQLRIKKKYLEGTEPDIEEIDTILWETTLPPQTALEDTIELSFDINEQDMLAFEITSNSNVDWQAIHWHPLVEYVSYINANGVSTSALNPDGSSQIAIMGTVDKQAYSLPLEEQPYFFVPSPNDTSFHIDARFSFTGIDPQPLVPFGPEGYISITVKSKNRLYFSNRIETPVTYSSNVNTPAFVLADHTIQGPFGGDTLYIDIHYSTAEVTNFFSSANTLLEIDESDFDANFFSVPGENLRLFGNFYKGWGQFTYRVPEGDANLSVSRDTVLTYIQEYENADLNVNNMPNNPNNFNSTDPDPTKKSIGLLYADASASSWNGYDPLLFVTDSTMSSSRLGEDNKQFASSSGIGGGLSAPVKLNKTESDTWSGNISLSSFTPNSDNPIPVGTYNIGDTFDDLDANGSFSGSSTESWQSVDLIDFNIDGFPDILGGGKVQYTSHLGQRTNIIRSHDSSFNTHKSKSSKWGVTSGAKTSQATVTNTFSHPKGGMGIHTGNNSTSGTIGVLGGASASSNFSLTANASVGLSGSVDHNIDRTVSSWLDVNGDGMVDAIQENGKIKLNLGYSFSDLEEWGDDTDIRIGASKTTAASANISGVFESVSNCHGSWSFGIGLSKVENHSLFGHQDVNGDGKADILTTDESNDLYAQINLGQKYTTPIKWVEDFKLDEGLSVNESVNGSFTVCINIGLFFRICVNPKGDLGRNVSMPKSCIVDINGDGFPDFLKSTADDNLTYALSTIGRTNKLKTISGPLGSEMTLDYKVIPSSYENPNPQWLLSTVETHDGYTHDGANTQKTTFEYEGGYKDRREREFYGFSKVVSHSHDTENEDAVYRTTIQHYANDTYYRKGLLLADTLMDAAGALYTTTEYEYELRAPLASSVQTLPNGFSADDSLAYPAQRRMSRAYYEGQAEAGLIHTTRYDYDLKGNTILYTDEGSGAPEEEVQAVIQYHSLPSLGIYSIPKDMQVTDHEGTVLRHRACEVYPENGNIKTIRQYYTSAEAAVFDYKYDDYGNITKVTRPENTNGERMTYEFTYDDEVNTYVVGTKDAYGYSSSATYDYRFGVPLTTTDLNDNQMTFAYDAKGRLTHLTGPYELASGTDYTIKMDYFPDAEPAYSVCRHYNEDTDSDILTVTFVDGLGRPVQVKKSGLLYQSSAQADQAVMNVSGKIMYDAFGREVATYYPVIEPVGDTTTINTQEDTEAAPTVVTYDVLDRQLKTTLPDATETVMHYEISEPPGGGAKAFATFTEDALGNTTEVYTDIRGRQLSTVAYGPDGPITTSFTYNAIAEVLTVTDVAGNTTTFTYDMLGRQTSIDHPVNGLTELFYDPLGNITRKLTANLRDFFGEDSGILYDYDYERPIRITYPLNYQNKVEYVYGSATDSTFNRRGKVVLQRDASGAQEFFYGPMGEITKTIRTVVLNPTEIRTYVSEARYDSWNRIQQLFYPDGEVVDYAYNEAGKLTRLSGERLGESYAYVNRISYDKFEKRRYIQFGNNTEQEYQYDPDRQWLEKMNARTDDRDFMDVDYAYDAVANILSVTNTQEPAEGQIGGAYTHNYTYDELYRIYSAEGSWVRGNRQEAYTLDMEFDNTHNILSKNQVRTRNEQPVFDEANYMQNYEYETGRPFVPSKVGRFQYDYDLNGNLLSVTDTTSLNLKEYEWDEENRLTAVMDNGYVSHYTYDATGERVIKSHGPVTGQAFNGSDNGFIDHRNNYTAYIKPEFVARQGSYTKHYFIEGQRICSKVGQGKFNNNSAEFGQDTLTAGSIDYVRWLSQVRANELNYYGDSLTVSHPTMPFRYVVPDSTGEAYPDLLPDAIVVTTPQSSIYVLPAQPDLSGNSQAGAPAWGIQNTISADSISAGYGMTDTIGLPREVLQYFYHSDHVGSTAYITDRNGSISQYAVYTAFGELFVEEQLLDADDSQPYLFNGKELDRETGLYYYGARYYEPISSMWMSVDPLANKYPGWSPYCYTMLNPVRAIDPNGKSTNDEVDNTYKETARNLGDAAGSASDLTSLAAASINPINGIKNGRFTFGWKANNGKVYGLNFGGGTKAKLGSKTQVLARASKWGSIGNVLSGISTAASGYQAIDAISRGDKLGAVEQSIDFSVGLLGFAPHPLAKAFSVGWSTGKTIDNLSKQITGRSLSTMGADWLYSTFGPLSFLLNPIKPSDNPWYIPPPPRMEGGRAGGGNIE